MLEKLNKIKGFDRCGETLSMDIIVIFKEGCSCGLQVKTVRF